MTTAATSKAYEMWFFASLEAGLGTLMLFVPEQFASPVFAGMHDILPPLGVVLLLSAALLLVVGYNDLSGRAVSLVLCGAAVPLFIVASNFVRVGTASGIVTWGFLALTLLWLALPSVPPFARPWERPLVGVAGAIELLLGIVFLLPTELVGTKTIGSFAQDLGVFGPSFVIAGAAVLVFEPRGPVWPRRVALGLAVLNFAAVWWMSAVENAIWTGILLYGLLLLVCLAALVPEPRDLTVSQKILGLFAAMLGAIVVVTLAMTAMLQGAAATASAVDRSETIIAASSELSEDVIDMQNAVRGFLLIGDEGQLAQYRVAHDRFASATARLGQLLADDADGLAMLGDARRSFEALNGYLERVISLYRQDPSRALAAVRVQEGVRLLQAGRADVGRLVDHETAIRERRESASAAAGDRLRASLIGTVTLLLIVGGGLALYLGRTIGRRMAALRQIAQTTASASDLERPIPVTARGDDVNALARAFEQMRVRLRDAFRAQERQAEELAAAKREADRANQAKSLFLANMSHELRTPLNAVLGFAELLDEQLAPTLSDRQRRFLANIQTSGRHLLALINDVLDLAKVEAERLELRREVVSLEELLAPIVEATAAAATKAGVRFSPDPLPPLRVRLDPTRTRQILNNLLSNAVKFTPAGGSVCLRASFAERDLLLAVEDTGIGIPEEARPRVFGLFERVSEARSDAPGTGLGLALTKRLVELHGGAIEFESAVGRGSTFTVRLPAALYVAGSRERVLIIENDASDAEFLAALAHEVGFETEVASSLREAQTALQHSRPRGVLLDLYLPDGHGGTVLEELKSDPETRDLPIMIVSVETDTARFRLMGADGCLTKPIDGEQLRAWLRAVRAAPAAAGAAG